MADWSELPVDILGNILLKLDSAEDIIYSSAVCSSWHCAYSTYKKKWTRSMPVLMLPETTTQDNPNCLRKLFCPNKQRCYHLKLPQTLGARCWGTSCGWLVIFDLNRDLYLFNPLTTAQISLPNPSTMPNYWGLIEESPLIQQAFLDKVIVFKTGQHCDDYLVVAVPGFVLDCLAYARPGDRAWTTVVTPEMFGGRGRVADVLLWGSQMLFLYDLGSVGYCDITKLQSSEPVTIMEYLPPPSGLLRLKTLHRFYMVESFGELLMVLRFKEEIPQGYDRFAWDPDVCYRTTYFRVYKLNFDTRNWTIPNDLGDVALFVGNNSSMAVRASEINNCKPNSIYFTDDEWQFWAAPTLGGHDMGIFDITNAELQTVYKGDDIRSSYCTALWFMPKF